MRRLPSALNVMKFCVAQQGFMVIGTTAIKLYPIGRVINVLWQVFMSSDYSVTGRATKKLWQEQADRLNLRWPGLVTVEKRNETGYKFFKAVPVKAASK